MKLLNVYKENGNIVKISFLGVPFYKKEAHEDVIKEKIFFGILYIKTYIEDLMRNKYKSYRLFGIELLSCRFDLFHLKYRLFGVRFLVKRPTKEFYCNILDKFINKYPQYDDYYILPAGMGEMYIYSFHFSNLLNKYKSNNYIFLSDKKYHKNVNNLFSNYLNLSIEPNVIYFIHVPLPKLFEYKGKRIFFLSTMDDAKKYNSIIKNSNGYYKDTVETNELGEITNYPQIKTKTYIENIGKYVLENNFIFVAPEVSSIDRMDNTFFELLCKKLKDKGYNIFLNLIDFTKYIQDTFFIYLAIEDALALAKMAKAIITHRCGFSECLTYTGVPMFVLYTNQTFCGLEKEYKKHLINNSDKVLMNGFLNNKKSSHLKKIWSVKEYPNANKDLIFEYDYNEYEDKNILIDEIADKISYLTQSS